MGSTFTAMLGRREVLASTFQSYGLGLHRLYIKGKGGESRFQEPSERTNAIKAALA